MKYYFIFILLIISTTLTAQNIEENPALAGRLNGNTAKLITCTEHATIKDSPGKETTFLHRTYTYNEGKLISDITFKNAVSPDSVFILYSYTDTLLQTKQISQHINMESDLQETLTEHYAYNQAAKLLRKTIITASGDTTVYRYSYNTSGLVDTIFADSAEDRRYVHYYSSGKLIRKTSETPVKDSAGWLLLGIYTYEYDKQGHLTSELHVYKNMERKKSHFVYDNKGRLIKKTVYVYADTKPVYTTEYIYDKKSGLPAGRVVKWLPDKNKLAYKTASFTYSYNYGK